MPLIFFYLFWLGFSVVYFLFGLLYFPGADMRVLLGLSISLGWVSALIVIILWTTGKTTEEKKKASKKNSHDNDDGQYPNGPANHFAGIGADGGWLYLYPDSLVFKPHAFNLAKKEVIIKYSDIAEVKPGGLNTFEVSSNTGKTDTFAVYKKQLWVNRIKKRLTAS